MCRRYIPLLLIVSVFSQCTLLKRINVSKTLKRQMGYPEDALLDFTQLAKKYGYYAEKHEVVTEDGYILKLFRLNSKKCDNLKQPPVFLMQGLLHSSESWLDSGPKSSLAYLIADHCYDLWVGNIRGSTNGRRHVALDPDKDKEFWNFCVDDNGYYDIPAQIDKILELTGSQTLKYIGHSQGCSEMAIACIERPQYCDKVEVFIALAPAFRMKNVRSLPFKLTMKSVAAFNPLLSQLGIYEFSSKGSLIQEIAEFTCQLGNISAALCELFQTADSFNPGSVAPGTWRKMNAHGIAGTSKKTFLQYAQRINDDDFRKFDYGPEINLELYGTEKAPRYELERMTIPTVLIAGLNDHTVDVRDVSWLKDHLPNVLEMKILDNPYWNHNDMVFSTFTPSLLFPTVNKYLGNSSQVPDL